MTTRITVDDGVRLETVVAGPVDAPGLLLVHGFGGAKEDFADHLDALALGHRVVTFDHRGHGSSDAPVDPRAYSLDRLAADTLTVADACELRDVCLLGHSMGGMVTRRAALHQPERFRALVFMDTSPGPPPLDRELIAFAIAIVNKDGLEELRRVQGERDPLTSAAYQRLIAERPGFAEYALRKAQSLSPVMWATLAAEMADQPNQVDALRALTVPTLVLVGDQDTTFLAPSRAIADAVPGSELIVIPDAGHSPQFENPAAWYAALAGFLARID